MSKVLSGAGSLAYFAAHLGRDAFQRVTLVAGAHFLQSDAGGALVAELGSRLAATIETPPGLLELSLIAQQRLPADTDALLAIGGGRTLDFAKALVHAMEGPRRFPFVAVPSTAGSGSEATSFAVVYRDGIKQSLERPDLRPDTVILDEEMLDSLTPRQRAISGLDALCQCFESLWSRRATDASRALALEGASWLWPSLPRFVRSGSGAGAALQAAHHSGGAIQLSRTTGPHALSYYLTARHGIDHGHAVALLFPVFLRYNEPALGALGNHSPLALLGVSNADEGVTRWQDYVRELGLPVTLPDLGLGLDIVPVWLQQVNAERFANNPVPFDGARLQQLIQNTLFL